jgi:hypothetical protein
LTHPLAMSCLLARSFACQETSQWSNRLIGHE